MSSLAVISLLSIHTELFKRGNFDFITKTEDSNHVIQGQALTVLTDDTTVELGYGGAAGGAKSWTGCVWLLFMCKAYPKTKWFIGREELKRLRETTLLTFYKVCQRYGVANGKDYKYNGQDHFIQFTNGSRIDLLDLKYLPSDPFYERYGSSEYTGGWIEEGGEVHPAAHDTLKTRIGRHLNDFYGLIRKLFTTCNPKKNRLHSHFWKPFKEGTLKPTIKFIRCLVYDNPHIESGYIDALKSIKDPVKKARLLDGNFDYDDDPSALIDYDSIQDYFTNSFVLTGTKYITADIARKGKDNTVIRVWYGWKVIERKALSKALINESTLVIKQMARAHGIPMSRVVVDEDGVGGGVMDNLNCRGFVNNSVALEVNGKKENYANLKSQCSFRIAERITNKELWEPTQDPELMQAISEEMEQVKQKDIDKDSKMTIIPKDKVKEAIGRSPDEWDSIMMREYFELNKGTLKMYN